MNKHHNHRRIQTNNIKSGNTNNDIAHMTDTGKTYYIFQILLMYAYVSGINHSGYTQNR